MNENNNMYCLHSDKTLKALAVSFFSLKLFEKVVILWTIIRMHAQLFNIHHRSSLARMHAVRYHILPN